MEEMRMDDQFVTEQITTFLTKRKITRSQPAPYKHGQNGDVEVLIKHQQEVVDKHNLDLSTGLWLSLMPRISENFCLLTPTLLFRERRVLWGQPKASFKNTPILPFGNRVLAHLPLRLSRRAFDVFYISRAPGVKRAMKLFI
jgi:hypothetical protein